MDVDWLISDKPLDYKAAISYMEQRVDDIIVGKARELIWLLEHPHTYTAGTSAQASELLNASDVPVYQVGRGGKYTYHGPGQRVIYCILDLKKIGNGEADLRKYIWQLEEWVICTLADFGIKGERRNGRVGIWVSHDTREAKIAAIGVRVKKWISYHGIAINMSPDMNYYKGIVPCGIKDYGVTSMKSLGVECVYEQLDNVLKQQFNRIFV
jgi:lipoyl(octanoyl) transferase